MIVCGGTGDGQQGEDVLTAPNPPAKRVADEDKRGFNPLLASNMTPRGAV